MRTISVINLKGGVGKSITSINMACCLSALGRRVLLVDNDKQGNSSKFMGVHSYDESSISDVLLLKADIDAVIAKTKHGVDVIPANMTLLKANKDVLFDTTKPQQVRLRDALNQVADQYDYCIIDNAPDINISVINALVACDDVIIPVKVDAFTFDGMAEIVEQMDDVRKYYNSKLRLAGCLVTSYRNNDVNIQGVELLKLQYGNVFESKIRWTSKVDESTFACEPIAEYSARCGAAKDYMALVKEYERGLVCGEV